MRRILYILMMLLTGNQAAKSDYMGPAEGNTNRFGRDFFVSNLASDSYLECKNQCAANPRCKAWTFVRRNIQGPTPRCWLKDTIPLQSQNDCCISGIKVQDPPPFYVGNLENLTNRFGSDYFGFPLLRNDPKLCRAECQAQWETTKQCRAWTYVAPNIQGPAPRCWLKNAIPPKSPNSCCVSGTIGNVIID